MESFIGKSCCLKGFHFYAHLLQVIFFDPLQEVIFQFVFDFVGLGFNFHEFVDQEQSFENLNRYLAAHQ